MKLNCQDLDAEMIFGLHMGLYSHGRSDGSVADASSAAAATRERGWLCERLYS